MLNIDEYILPAKEVELLKLIAKTGFYVDAYRDKFKLSTRTIYSCIQKGLIYKDRTLFVFTKLLTPYLLTDKGIDIVKNKYLISPYRSNSTQSDHDFVLGNIYLSLSKSERNSWITETGLNMLYPNTHVVDGFYIDSSGNKVGIEVITKSYTENTIDDKYAFIANYCDKSIVIDIEKL